MRKRIITPEHRQTDLPDMEWLDIEELAEVEITSEDVAHPVEFALLPDQVSGWRASESGIQTIRLIFDQPQTIKRILLQFVDNDTERTQEFVLRWSPDGGQSFREIVRQQWNFSPEGASSETEELHVDLTGVTVIELNIIPDICGGDALASLTQLRLA